MRLFLEVFEVVPSDDPNLPPPVEVRVELSDESEAEEVYQKLSGYFKDKKHIVRLHYCRHEEGEPCTTKVLYDFS